jgi:hypothetical protein
VGGFAITLTCTRIRRQNLHFSCRRNLWRSLYVMDCFMAMSLGRPNAIDCEIASALCSTSAQQLDSATLPEGNSLFFTVNASKIVGEVLSRVYHKRKASRSIAYLLLLRFSEWMRTFLWIYIFESRHFRTRTRTLPSSGSMSI